MQTLASFAPNAVLPEMVETLGGVLYSRDMRAGYQMHKDLVGRLIALGFRLGEHIDVWFDDTTDTVYARQGKRTRVVS